MKKFNLLLLSVLFVINCYSQPSLIKKEISKIFFGVNFPLTRFDIREKFNGSINLFDYKELNYSNTDYDDCEVKFKNNPVLSYTQSSVDKYFSVRFNKGYDMGEFISLYMYYKIKDVTFCRNQLNELIKKFKLISYKVDKEDKYENDDINKKKIGENYFIYSTLSNYKKNNHCIFLDFVYRKVDNPYKENTTYTTPNGEYYIIRLTTYPQYFN